MKEALVVMAKAPVEGRVKTRLIGALNAATAAELYVAFLSDTFAVMEEVRDEREAEAEETDEDYTFSIVLNYTPEGEEEAFERVEREGSLMIAQRGDDLGERLHNCFADLFEAGFASVVIIGADSPTLPGEYLMEAFDGLDDENAVVLGPTKDGGYYLIGMRRLHAGLFEGIPWSTDGVLAETRKRANAAGLSVVLLPEWYDVDTPEELEHLKRELGVNKEAARFTRRLLKSLK
ncbi:MAG TPA: TIGR04282 family arsenosugar biosynthesis glycosyltransferase [Blastocatellia bacterium]|nr:TIGR04282 family arsenosugar biosynthesis glycosyltransferase [Blastocatellia bacterium]